VHAARQVDLILPVACQAEVAVSFISSPVKLYRLHDVTIRCRIVQAHDLSLATNTVQVGANLHRGHLALLKECVLLLASCLPCYRVIAEKDTREFFEQPPIKVENFLLESPVRLHPSDARLVHVATQLL